MYIMPMHILLLFHQPKERNKETHKTIEAKRQNCNRYLQKSTARSKPTEIVNSNSKIRKQKRNQRKSFVISGSYLISSSSSSSSSSSVLFI